MLIILLIMLQKVTKQHQEDLHENKSITKLAKIFISHHEEQDKDQPVEEGKKTRPKNMIQTLNTPYFQRQHWKTKKRARKFHEETQKSYIDQKGSFQWLQNG